MWPFSFQRVVKLTWRAEDGPFVEAEAASSFISFLMSLVAPGYSPAKWSVKSVVKYEAPEESESKSASGQGGVTGPQVDSDAAPAPMVTMISLSIEFTGAADAAKFATLIDKVKISRRRSSERSELKRPPLPAEHGYCES